jgi:hypothetical protein
MIRVASGGIIFDISFMRVNLSREALLEAKVQAVNTFSFDVIPVTPLEFFEHSSPKQAAVRGCLARSRWERLRGAIWGRQAFSVVSCLPPHPAKVAHFIGRAHGPWRREARPGGSSPTTSRSARRAPRWQPKKRRLPAEKGMSFSCSCDCRINRQSQNSNYQIEIPNPLSPHPHRKVAGVCRGACDEQRNLRESVVRRLKLIVILMRRNLQSL